MLRKKSEVIEAMRSDKSLRLEWHQGVRDHNWYWLRRASGGEPVYVDGRAGRAAANMLTRVSGDWRSTVYVLDAADQNATQDQRAG